MVLSAEDGETSKCALLKPQSFIGRNSNVRGTDCTLNVPVHGDLKSTSMMTNSTVSFLFLSQIISWCISGCHSMAVPRPSQGGRHLLTQTDVGHSGSNSRREFSVSVLGAASAFLLRPTGDEANAAWWNPFEKEEPYTYADFKTMLRSGQILQVTFGVGGTSLICVDATGVSRSLVDLPDDLTLLRELYQRNVSVTMEDIPPRAMSASEWFKDVMGLEELTDEEKYKYRGYKTFRMNTKGEVPSGLLTNFNGR